ncbi:MAG TPA: hypothetical protein VNF07_05760 [Acidimicrobiales bacterium]|nr:hypothetical protein [Acidimicrobiales bacterium]
MYLCGTTPFVESVAIEDKALELTGDAGASIVAPASAAAPTTFFSDQGLQTPNAVVTVIGDDNVEISGLTISGPFQNTGCGGDDYGVLQVASGDPGHLSLDNDVVQNIGAASQASLGGCQYGVGIEIGRRYWPNLSGASGGFNIVNFAGDANVRGTSVSGYQKNGITADGPGSNVEVDGSTVNGGGQTALIARNGIQISRGAGGEVHGSTVAANEYTGPGGFASATGLLVYGGCGDPLSVGVKVHDDTFSNNDSGVVIGDYSADPNCVASATTPTDNEIHGNSIDKTDGETNHSPFTDAAGNAYTGYQVGIADTGNSDTIHDNTITGTIVGGADTAYGPQTAPGGNFLAPIDLQTYPAVNAKVHDNRFDGGRLDAAH